MMIANKYLLQHKYMRLIPIFAGQKTIPLRSAMDVFYRSRVYQEMRAGVSDMHCRSDLYLAEELQRELAERQ
jgi:hypothetical protein